MNFQLLKFLFRDKTKEIFSKYQILSCLDKAAEVHGFKIMLLLRFCPILVINLIIQFLALTAVSYKNFVMSGFTAILPIAFMVIQGTQIKISDNCPSFSSR